MVDPEQVARDKERAELQGTLVGETPGGGVSEPSDLDQKDTLWQKMTDPQIAAAAVGVQPARQAWSA